MRIAGHLGRPLSHVLSEVPDRELAYWAAWFAHEPSDGQRVEYAIAQLTRNFIAANSKKGHKPPSISDLLMPDWWIENNRKRAARRDSDNLENVFREAGLRIITKRK